MPTFIKPGFWENRIRPAQGLRAELNLDHLIRTIADPAIPGPQGPIGPQGIQGPQGTAGNSVTILGSVANRAAFDVGPGASPGANIGDAWILLSDGSLISWNGTIWFDAGDIQGPPGAQGPIGPQGVQADLLGVPTDILPDVDNLYSLGNADYRWKSIHIGPGTIYITDTVTGLDAGLTVTNGALLVDGVSVISVASIQFPNASIQNTAYIPAVSQTFDPLFTDASGTLAGVTATGHYTMLSPKVCFFRIKVLFDNCTNFGTGQYQFTLPFPSVETLRTGNATIHERQANTFYHIAGIADITFSLSIMKLYYSGSTTDLAWKYNTPVNSTNVHSHFDISGTYEIA